jgi:hypothetical protein
MGSDEKARIFQTGLNTRITDPFERSFSSGEIHDAAVY